MFPPCRKLARLSPLDISIVESSLSECMVESFLTSLQNHLSAEYQMLQQLQLRSLTFHRSYGYRQHSRWEIYYGSGTLSPIQQRADLPRVKRNLLIRPNLQDSVGRLVFVESGRERGASADYAWWTWNQQQVDMVAV